jgi:hypothetical protein
MMMWTYFCSATNLKAVRSAALKHLMEQMELDFDETALHCNVVVTDTHFGIHPFYIRRGTYMNTSCFFFSCNKFDVAWSDTCYTAAFAVCSKDKEKIIPVLGYVFYTLSHEGVGGSEGIAPLILTWAK